MTHNTASKQGLEPVYPEGHHLGTQVFYDTKAGQYYDASSDLYIYGLDCRIPFCEKEYLGNANGIGN